MMYDLYLFLFGLALLLLSIAIVGAMTAMVCYVILKFKQFDKKESEKDGYESEDEKRRKRNDEIIKKYMR